MTKSPDEILSEPYSRILIPDENGLFAAELLEFPGCFSDGRTAEEAFKNLEEAAKSWILASQEQGHEIPEPLMNQGFNGKIALRLPRSLHRLAVRYAEREGISLNQFLVSAIASKIGAEEYNSRLINALEKKVLGTVEYINQYLQTPSRAFTTSRELVNIINFSCSNTRNASTNKFLEVRQNA